MARHGGPGTSDPGRITFVNTLLGHLVFEAYDIPYYRVADPKSFLAERYDISAIIPPGATKDDLKIMLQNLLFERFHLTMHFEIRPAEAYDLVVAKAGSKLKESATPDLSAPDGSSDSGPRVYNFDSGGFPVFEGSGLWMAGSRGPDGIAERLRARSVALTKLVDFLTGQLHAPVADMTGLTGRYDFTLEYAPSYLPTGESPFPLLTAAVEKQLGLQLVQKKVPTRFMVIDHVDKMPSEN